MHSMLGHILGFMKLLCGYALAWFKGSLMEEDHWRLGSLGCFGTSSVVFYPFGKGACAVVMMSCTAAS